MQELRNSIPGLPLNQVAAKILLRFASQKPNCVVDGFPSTESHLALLPADSIIVLLSTTKTNRNSRLAQRSELTVRKWTPGAVSAREIELPELIRRARRRFKLLRITNSGSIDMLADKANALVSTLSNPK
jgi:hypothetical protein